MASKKIKLSQSRKDYIKKNFAKLKKANLSGESLRYYNLIKAGKKSAKQNIRIKGKYVGGRIKEIIIKIAKARNISPQKYIDENIEAVTGLIERGYTTISKNIDRTIELVANSRRKKVEVSDGEGGTKNMDKLEVIESLAMFQNYVKSNSNIVMLAVKVKTFPSGKIAITIPTGYRGKRGERLIEYLEEFPDIDIVISDKQ